MLCLQEGNVKTVVVARGGGSPRGPVPLGRAVKTWCISSPVQ